MSDKQKSQKGFRQKFTKVKTAKGRKSSSTRWLQRQLNDPYTLMAKKDFYRSRAAYKLLEIDRKFNIIKKSNKILDLGCSPGGWVQICYKINPNAHIIGVDILEMDLIAGTHFIKGDFLLKDIQEKIIEVSGAEKQFDLITSDISPPTCGHSNTDHLRIMNIIEVILQFNNKYLNQNGNFISKIFLGSETDILIKECRSIFKTVKLFKPDSSHKESKEQYLICLDYKC